MHHFTLTDRKVLSSLLQEGRSRREIAKVIGCTASSVCDEIRRNSGQAGYDPHVAHRRAEKRRLVRKKRSKLEISPGLRQFVIGKLREEWSPEQIAAYLRKEAGGKKTVICHETIYQLIYSDEGRRDKLWLSLRHKRRPQRTPRGSRIPREIIPHRVSIHKRPESVNKREEFGHWEGDLVIFSVYRYVLAVFVERVTRKVIAILSQNKTAEEMRMALHELIGNAGQVNVRSITFDNGTENVCHQQVREEYAETFQTYFCDPYCSW